MKVITFFLDEGHSIKKIMDDEGANNLLEKYEKGIKSKNIEKKVILGYDLNGNPFYIKVSSILAIDVSEFDIKDL